MSYASTCLAVALGLSLPVLAGDGPPADAERLEGVWQAVEGEAGGAPIPPDDLKKIRIRIDAGTFQTFFDGKPNSPKNRVKLLTDAKPKGIDLLADEGGEKGRVRDRGIYELDGDRLKLCIHEGSRPGKDKDWDRPTAFKSEKGSRLVVIVLTRVKE